MLLQAFQHLVNRQDPADKLRQQLPLIGLGREQRILRHGHGQLHGAVPLRFRFHPAKLWPWQGPHKARNTGMTKGKYGNLEGYYKGEIALFTEFLS